jgi:hypothetical protein
LWRNAKVLPILPRGYFDEGGEGGVGGEAVDALVLDGPVVRGACLL